MKTMLCVLFVSLIIMPIELSSQTETNWLWANSAGGAGYDRGSEIFTNNIGESYAVGSFELTATFSNYAFTSAGEEDAFITKSDSSGNLIWAKRAGGSGDDGASGVTCDNSGNVYVTGRHSSGASFGTYILSESGLFVAKLDSNGNWLWVVHAAGSSTSIDCDVTGNCYITGQFNNDTSFGSTTLTSNGWGDIFVAKIDTEGNWLWALGAGGSQSDSGSSISVNSSANCQIIGSFQDSAGFGPFSLTSSGNSDIFVAKIDTFGNWLWAKRAGGTSSDSGNGISTDNNGYSYITGSFFSNAEFGSITLSSVGGSGSDIFAAKLDTNGNWLWAKRAGSSLSYEHGYDVVHDDNGNCYITGVYRGWAIFGTFSLDSDDVNHGDVFIAKLNSEGDFRGVISAGGRWDTDSGYGISIDNNGYIYSTGIYTDTAYFGSITLTSTGEDNTNCYVGKVFIIESVATPSFNPSAGQYITPQYVTISCSTPLAQIRYTTNGTDPSEASTAYTDPIYIDHTTQIMARAFRQGWEPSTVSSALYTITGTVATPQFNPPPGNYTTPQYVYITCNTPGAQIFYTMNGIEPNQTSQMYEDPVYISQDTTLKARAYLDGWIPSDLAIGQYSYTVSNMDDTIPSVSGIVSIYPNPFCINTTIMIDVKKQSERSDISVYNIRGELVFKREILGVGRKEIDWYAYDDKHDTIASGIYFLVLRSGSEVSIKKAVHL